jgi:tetratricopeptide (TPR) repeat protein
MKKNRRITKSLYLLINRNKIIIPFLFFLLFIIAFSNSATAQKAYHKLCSKGFNYEDNGNIDEAIAKYNEAIALKPNKWNAYSLKSYANFKQEKYNEAITDISKAIDLSPSKPSLYYIRANCYYEQEIYDKAIADYSKVVSKSSANDKQLYSTYFKRARAYYNSKQYQESVNDLTKAITLAEKQKTKTDYMYNWRARCNIELGKYDDAIKDYDIYLVTNPNEINSIFYIGYAYNKTGNTNKAKEYAAKVTELDLASEKYFSGATSLSIYDLEKRRKTASNLLALAKDNIAEFKEISSKALLNITINEAFHNLDSAWFLAPKLSKDDYDLKDSITSAYFIVYPKLKDKPEIPENARKYSVQANKATEEKDYNTALSLWNSALSIVPYYPLAYYNCAMIREFLGNYPKAISNMKKYLKLAPDAADARSAQDQIYSWEGKSNTKTTTIIYGEPALNNKLRAETFTSLGSYTVAFAFGSSIGLQLDKNNSLSDYWDQEAPGLMGAYDTTMHIPLSGDFEFIIRPVKRLGIGMFAKTLGGIGTTTKLSGVKYHLNMRSNQIGGLVRFYMMLGNMGSKPDLFLQFNYGTNSLNGYYGSSTSGVFNYCETLKGKAPFVSFGFGVGGKVGKVSYITFSMDYYNSSINDITYKVTADDANPALIGASATSTKYTANYNGIVFKLMLLGFCF